LFECGKHKDAILRVDDLIDTVNDKSQYIAVRVGTQWSRNPSKVDSGLQAQMLLLLGSISMRRDNERAIELFKRAQEAIPFGQGPYLVVISLVS